jgi:hypothetical protein
MPSPLAEAKQVKRAMTLAGGFEVALGALPAKPSGRTGVGGELLMPEISDASLEAHRLLFELQRTLVSVAEELHGERHVVAEERLKTMMMRVDDLRKYVSTLAKQNLVPFVCPRCQSEKTDDAAGDRMCPLCVTVAFRRVPR